MYDALSLVGKVAGTITALAIVIKALLVVADLTATLKTLLRIMPNLELSARLAPLVDVLLKEFRPNGGSSMKDQVTRIQQSQSHLSNQVEAAHREASEAKKEAIDLKQAMSRQDEVLATIREGVTKNSRP